MLIKKEIIFEAKEKFGEKAAFQIAEDLKLEKFDNKNLKSLCPFHSEDTGSFIWYAEQYMYKCFGCGRQYDIINHYMEYNGLTYLGAIEKLFMQVDIQYRFGEKGVKTKKFRYPNYDSSESREKVEKYLLSRGISKETLDYTDTQQDKNGNVVFHFYDSNDVLSLVKYRPSRNVKPKENKSWCQPNTDTKHILFNMNKIDPTKPLVITEGECFSGNTEILTEGGWIRFDQYNNEKVMTVDESLNGNFVVPQAYIKKMYDGKMISLKKKGYHQLITPEHNLIYSLNGKIHKKKFVDMPDSISYAQIPTAIFYDNNTGGIKLSDNQLRLFIAISADGTLDKRKNGSLYVRAWFSRERKIKRFESLLQVNNIEYIKTIHQSRKKMGYFFGFVAPSWINTKIFPHEWISQFSNHQREIFIDEILYWDGNRVPNRNQIEYSSKEYSNISFVQTIVSLHGYMSTIMMRKNKFGEWYKLSILFNKHSICWQKMHSEHTKELDYNDFVYCVQVPSGMILVRYDNKITVSGNCDALSVIEAGYKNVVSVPLGSNNMQWIEENWDFLEQFDKIIVWSDNDTPGINMRKDVCSRLGTWRTYFIDIPDELPTDEFTFVEIKDANDVLVYLGKDKVLEFIENAQEMPIENIIGLHEIGDFDIETAPGLYSGFDKLDNYIYKFVFGTVVILTGRNGNGKSVLLNQMFVAEPLEQGYDVFVYSAEMGKPLLKSWIELVLAGRENAELKNNSVHKVNPDALKQVREWYKNRIFVYDNDKDLSADSILDRLETVVRRFGVKVAVLDNLLTIDLGVNANSETNLWQEQKKFIVKLVNFASKYNILIVLVAHPRKTAEFRRLTSDDIAGSGDLTNLVHYVMAVHRYGKLEKEGEKDSRGNYKKGKEPVSYDCVIDLFKNRITGHTGEMQMYFDYLSYRFYTKPAELWKRYKWDKNKGNKPIPKHDPNKHDVVPDIINDDNHWE